MDRQNEAERSGLYETIIARQPTGHPRPKAVAGDFLPAASRLRPPTSKYLIAQKEGDAELDFAMLLEMYINGESSSAELEQAQTQARQQVQPAMYNGVGDKGKLYLMRGSRNIDKIACDAGFNNPAATNGPMLHCSFSRLAKDAAKLVGTAFVFVDMGSSNDDFNRMLTTSCDIVQPTIAPDMFSWSCATQMLACVLPQWLKHWAWVDKLCKGKQTGLMSTYKGNRFPHIMPFMAMHYDIEIKGRDFVRWADANYVSAVSTTYKELTLFVKGGIDGVGFSPAEAELMTEETRLHWRKFIEHEHATDLTEQDGKFGLDLIKKVQANFMIEDMPPVVLLLRHLKFMSVCNEIGRAISDADPQSLRDYYFGPGVELDEEDEKMVTSHWVKVKREKEYVSKQMTGLAESYDGRRKKGISQRAN
ncbi:hypothetical protein FOA52_002250 [Chlamydomonas sp. UWO 241]|nr:hypothetical protein FOA52_002250 [Chlamydomonas sp. UWO 241]